MQDRLCSYRATLFGIFAMRWSFFDWQLSTWCVIFIGLAGNDEQLPRLAHVVVHDAGVAIGTGLGWLYLYPSTGASAASASDGELPLGRRLSS
jgi:hypothetical protein